MTTVLPAAPTTSEIMGVCIDDVSNEETVGIIARWVDEARAGGSSRQIVTTNPEFVMAARHNRAFRQLLNSAALATPDGQGLIWASRLLPTHRLRQRAPGVELVEMLAAEAAQRDWRIFLLGAAPGVAEATAKILAGRYPGFAAAGCYSGSPDSAEDGRLCQMVMGSGADIVLVAYGAPKQDFWIARNIAAGRLHSPLGVAIGVGGAFDFISGRAIRAPRIMRRLGLEWLHRLYKQPWRYRRILTVIYFGWLVVLQALRLRLRRRKLSVSKQEEDSGLKCANHPTVTTYVRCSKCGKPICTRCMFATPVGYRCADCYNPQIAPLYKIDPSKLPRAIAGGLGLAAVGGVLVAFLPDFVFFIALLMGFLVSDLIGRLSNEKHGPTMQYIGIGCVVASLVVALVVYSLLHPGAFNYAFDTATPLSQLPSYYIDLPRFSNNGNGQLDLFTLIMFGMAAFMAWIRLR